MCHFHITDYFSPLFVGYLLYIFTEAEVRSGHCDDGFALWTFRAEEILFVEGNYPTHKCN